MRFMLALVVGLSLIGCATRGTNFSSEVDWIKKGETTKEEIQRVLGNPYQVGSSSSLPTWTYGFYSYRLFGESYTKELKIYWNREGTVRNYSFSSSFPEDVNAGLGRKQAPKQEGDNQDADYEM